MQAMNDGDSWQLHVRKASGETLTVEESQQLQAWYALQDQAEIAQLKLDAPADSMNDLNAQIHEMLGHIAVVTKNIRQMLDENKILSLNHPATIVNHHHHSTGYELYE